ncbi:patatin-like phospholipase family protein [Roseibium album]|nr:patatin-like phospholipase family protein [Roseibium album]
MGGMEMVKWRASSEAGLFKPGELSSYDPTAVGFSMSGGGYRATLFHAGAILRLNELGVLPRIDRISSVSGGSITNGILAKAWLKLDFDPATGVASENSIRTHFLDVVRNATSRTLDVRTGFAGFLPFVSAGNRLASLYDRYIFDGIWLAELPEHPKFIFNATNLQTQGLLRFTKNYLADWRALKSTTRGIRVADAVAASSAFPPVLSPMRLDLRDEDVIVPDGARFNEPELLKEPILVDGGVYDNLGLEAIWKRCGVLISSYAGLNSAAEPSNFNFDHMLPVIYSFLASSIDWRERMLVSLFQHKLADGLCERIGAYWTAGTDITKYKVPVGWVPSSDELNQAANTPTRLEALNRQEQDVVIRAGYAYADAGMRRYLLTEVEPPAGPPVLA